MRESRTFRALIHTLIAASLPLAGTGGCTRCLNDSSNAVAPETVPRVRLVEATCRANCGEDISLCYGVLDGEMQNYTVDCNGTVKVLNLGLSGFSVLPDDCGAVCEQAADECHVKHGFATPWTAFCTDSYSCSALGASGGIARRPAEFSLGPCEARDDIGAFFAMAAQLEAAAIDAFAMLAAELRAHGAPPDLIRRAERAQHDEQRHARMTRGLARRFAASTAAPCVQPRDVRSLLEIAMENVVEGCVREAYGAFVASWQAQAATDDAVRRVMKRIAPDEIRHAELAFAVAEWIWPQLSAAEQSQLAAAHRCAVEALVRDLARPYSPSLQSTAGLPSPEVAQAFVRAQIQLAL